MFILDIVDSLSKPDLVLIQNLCKNTQLDNYVINSYLKLLIQKFLHDKKSHINIINLNDSQGYKRFQCSFNEHHKDPTYMILKSKDRNHENEHYSGVLFLPMIESYINFCPQDLGISYIGDDKYNFHEIIKNSPY